MNKRLISLILAVSCAASLVCLTACGDKVDPSDEAEPEAIEIVTNAEVAPGAEQPSETTVAPASEDLAVESGTLVEEGASDPTASGMVMEVDEATGEMTITRPENATEAAESAEAGSKDAEAAASVADDASSETAAAPSTRSLTRAASGVTTSFTQPPQGVETLTTEGGTSYRAYAANPDPDTWTIFVYMCGSNLESSGGAATNDLAEMVNASGSENVRFVVEAGGTSRWSGGNKQDAKQIRRFLIQESSITIEDIQPQSNMGEPGTLASFLAWGLENYPAEHMGVIMWDHGAGSIGGVCNDENYRNDSLTLRELDSAFASVYKNMTRKFDFIGFDCCLMSTLETANIFASYADYMYASEEVEPGAGWNYSDIMEFLASDPSVDGETLGRFVVDSFMNYYQRSSDSSFVTMSLIDLSQMDPLVKSFSSFTQELCDVCADQNKVAPIVRGITSADNFGGNNRIEGYANMVDLGGLVDACSGHVTSSGDVRDYIAEAVLYTKAGRTHANASGLSVYYPLAIQGSSEMTTFSDVCVTPFYLTFVDSITQASVYGANNSMFNYDNWFDQGTWEQGGGLVDQFLANPFDFGLGGGGSDYFTYLDSYQQTGASSLITFAQKPHFDANGTYGFQLNHNGLSNAANVTAYVYQVSGHNLIELGETTDVYGSWDTGKFYDGFDGNWLSLPDGQNLATYIADETDSYVVYTSPILLNGKETYLRTRQYFQNRQIVVEGTWSGVDSDGISARDLEPLEVGDVIVPCYYDFASEDSSHDYEGRSCTVSRNFRVAYSGLSVGQYSYSFVIDDIYGDYLMVDPVYFYIERNGDIYYSDRS
ncbi:MAG: clostripain-related cysteine peptidase [Coriobacteriales bacterium]|jgi:hypothetical protein